MYEKNENRDEKLTALDAQDMAGGEAASVESESPLSFEELLKSNKAYQSAFDRKISQALETARHNWDKNNGSALDEIQHAREEIAASKAALEADRLAFEHMKRQNFVSEELKKRDMDPALAPFLTGSDNASSINAVNEVEAIWKNALQNHVNTLMRGNPPRAVEAQSTEKDPVKAAFKREGL